MNELRWETRLLVMVAAVLTVFGIASLFAAATLEKDAVDFFTKQLVGAVIGVGAMVAVARIDYHHWQKWAWPLLFLTIFMLIIPLLPFTHAISPSRNGARRWIQFGPANVQPSEVARFTVAVWVAMLAAKKGAAVRDFKKGLLPFLVILGLVCLLILLEPNMSMSVLVALVGFAVLFTAGARLGHFLMLIPAGALAGLALVLVEPYRMTRVKCFFQACEGAAGSFQLDQALLGFGSGGAFGVGFGHGQLKLHYLPYGYSDFLFSTIGEEWGYVGVAVIVLLFAVFGLFGFRIARTARDQFGQFLAVGLTCAISLGALLHMAVTLGLMPTTGLAFPFMSYGRSGLIMALVSVGVLVNIGRSRSGFGARG